MQYKLVCNLARMRHFLSKYTMYRLDDAGSTARAFVLLSECVKIDDVSGGIDDAAWDHKLTLMRYFAVQIH